jgi:DNA-binding transcriptional LysR family regulator
LSTISTHVGAIEARVGATLFRRAHGAFILTEFGEEVRKHAETIVAAEAAIMAAATLVKQRELTEGAIKERQSHIPTTLAARRTSHTDALGADQ